MLIQIYVLCRSLEVVIFVDVRRCAIDVWSSVLWKVSWCEWLFAGVSLWPIFLLAHFKNNEPLGWLSTSEVPKCQNARAMFPTFEPTHHVNFSCALHVWKVRFRSLRDVLWYRISCGREFLVKSLRDNLAISFDTLTIHALGFSR